MIKKQNPAYKYILIKFLYYPTYGAKGSILLLSLSAKKSRINPKGQKIFLFFYLKF